MELKEAEELLRKLKPLENRVEMKTGGIINRFFIVPKEYLTDKGYDIYWPDFWSDDVATCPNKNHGKEYTIIAVKRTESGVVFVSKDFEYIKELGQYQ